MKKMENLILDVDGVFTDGNFYYTKDGKVMKRYGPHDNDGIKMLKGKMNIQTISADVRGFEITKKRIDDMKIPIQLVSEKERIDWLKKHFDLEQSIYMGDGIHDAEIFNYVGYSIAPNNAFYLTRDAADYVTKTDAGHGAVLEACLHILEKFFHKPFNIH